MSTRASTSGTILRGLWLFVARAAWMVIAALTFGVFVAAIPGYFTGILKLGQADWMGAPVEAPVALVFALDLLGVLASVTAALVCLTLATVLFWRRSNDWMVVFTSSYLLLYGTIMAGPLEWAEDFYPAWPSLAVDVIQPLLLTTPTVALVVLFPDGRFVPRWTRWLILLSIALLATTLYLPLAYWGTLLVVMLLGTIYAQVFRYRHYDTDVVINRTLVYGLLTLMLLLVFFGSVTSLQYAFRALSGHAELPQLTIVVSTLVIAALFNPLRRRIQAFIDRSFYRNKYDAAKTLEGFSMKLRDETDLEALSDDLVGVVRETMQPAHVSLWLRPETTSKGRQKRAAIREAGRDEQ